MTLRWRPESASLRPSWRCTWIGVHWNRTVDLAYRPPIVRFSLWICVVPFLRLSVVLRRR